MARSKGVVIPISAEDNSARAFDSVNAQVAKLREQVAMLRAGGGGAGEALAGGMHNATTQVQATSAALRTLEGNPGIRAMERFLITIPGVGAALLGIFPAIGGLAVLDTLYKGVEALEKINKAAQGAAAATQKAFSELHDKSVDTTDALQIENDKLQEQIDKLQKHPNNGLQAALDEAKKSCDDLIVSLNDAGKEYEQLLKKNTVGVLASLLGGGENTKQQVEELRAGYADLTAKARELNTQYLTELSGANNPADVNSLAEKRVKQIHDLFDPQIAAMKKEAQRLQDEQNKPRSVGVGSNKTSYVQDNRVKIANVEGAAQVFADQEAEQLAKVQHASLEGKKGELTKDKPDHSADKMREAQDRLASAQREAAQATAKEASAEAKAAEQEELAALEDKHKRQLISDEDYYRQKAAMQKAALELEKNDVIAQQYALEGQVAKLQGQKLTGAASVDRDAKVIELQSKITDLQSKVVELGAKEVANQSQLNTELAETVKKRQEEAEKLASAAEAIRGGSTDARQSQLAVDRGRQRQGLVINGASTDALGNFDYQTATDSAGLVLKGAEDTQKNADSGISTARQSVKYQEASGQISSVQARQELIELDKQEAEALQPVLAAYEQLAALNVDGAAEKVAALKEQIAELKAPVDEVAAEIRGQLNSAFESLFENMDKGKKDWQSFVKMLQSDVMKDTYKSLVEPGLQTAMSALIPKSGAAGGAGATASPASAVGGLFGKLLGMPGVTKGSGAGAGITVNIVNQSSTPVQGTATSSGTSDMTEMIRPSVIQIMLEDLDHGGSVSQALAGISV